MSGNLIKGLVTLLICSVLAIFLGYSLAERNYFVLWVGVSSALGVAAVVAGGYAPMLALGLLTPFALPLPFIHNFPFIGGALGVIYAKYTLQRSMHRIPAAGKLRLHWTIIAFYGWVGLRYAIDPVFPNAMGFGSDVTGFRSYLSYVFCLGIVLAFLLTIRTREELQRVMRWMVYISLFFIVMLIPLIFTSSPYVATWLMRLGMFVTFFDNGWLRFVVLPLFGIVVLAASMIPSLFPTTRNRRIILLGMGVIAVLLGGNRSSFLMSIAFVLLVSFLQGRRVLFLGVLAGLIASLGLFYFVGERMRFQSDVGFMRIMALTSSRVARMTDAEENIKWRRVRWERAKTDIQVRPFLGWGYGGLENAFLWRNAEEFARASLDRDVATGNIHNGFLSGTRAIGIPGISLFILVVIASMWMQFRGFRDLRHRDRDLSDLHLFLLGMLMVYLMALYTGSELNNREVWFFIGFGSAVMAVRKREAMDSSLSLTETEPISAGAQPASA